MFTVVMFTTIFIGSSVSFTNKNASNEPIISHQFESSSHNVFPAFSCILSYNVAKAIDISGLEKISRDTFVLLVAMQKHGLFKQKILKYWGIYITPETSDSDTKHLIRDYSNETKIYLLKATGYDGKQVSKAFTVVFN